MRWIVCERLDRDYAMLRAFAPKRAYYSSSLAINGWATAEV
ncbi:hypothetical protein [Rhizobium binae]